MGTSTAGTEKGSNGSAECSVDDEAVEVQVHRNKKLGYDGGVETVEEGKHERTTGESSTSLSCCGIKLLSCCEVVSDGNDTGTGKSKRGKKNIGLEDCVTDVDECCSSGTCCFGQVLSSGNTVEACYGVLLDAKSDEILVIPRHSVVEVSVNLELGDSVAWAFEVVQGASCHGLSRKSPSLKFSAHWFDTSDSSEKSVHSEQDAYGVPDCWPSRFVSASQGSQSGFFSVDGNENKGAARAALVLTFDNSRAAVESKKVRLTLQHRGRHYGCEISTPYGKGTVAGWSGSTFQVDLGFGKAYLPASNVVGGGMPESPGAACSLSVTGSQQHSQLLRSKPAIRVQHMHKEYKYYPSLETLGINTLAGAFDWSENAQHALWDKLGTSDKKILADAFSGFDISSLVDYHVHIVGSGQSGSGCYLTPKMTNPFQSPFGYIKLRAFMSAAGITMFNSDAAYEKRLIELCRHVHILPNKLKKENAVAKEDLENKSHPEVGHGQNLGHNKMLTLAFEKVYDEDGSENISKTTLHIPNDYAMSFAARNSNECVASCSIHPYRLDCELELERCARRGIRVIKWLPNSMQIDPLSPLCDRFYRKVKELDMVILSHAGEEHSVSSAGLVNEYGNPLRLRRALDAGCKVIAAHLATEGSAVDLDKIRDQGQKCCLPAMCGQPREECFRLMVRLLNEKRYKNLLFADFSAIICIKRAKYIREILDELDHSRLVYGSDLPVPALNFAVVLRQLRFFGYIAKAQSAVLKKIYKCNPYLFDICCKLMLRTKKGSRITVKSFYENPNLQIVGWQCPKFQVPVVDY